MFFDPGTRELLRTWPSPLTWDQPASSAAPARPGRRRGHRPSRSPCNGSPATPASSWSSARRSPWAASARAGSSLSTSPVPLQNSAPPSRAPSHRRTGPRPGTPARSGRRPGCRRRPVRGSDRQPRQHRPHARCGPTRAAEPDEHAHSRLPREAVAAGGPLTPPGADCIGKSI
jgi:hypothetical protein